MSDSLPAVEMKYGIRSQVATGDAFRTKGINVTGLCKKSFLVYNIAMTYKDNKSFQTNNLSICMRYLSFLCLTVMEQAVTEHMSRSGTCLQSAGIPDITGQVFGTTQTEYFHHQKNHVPTQQYS